MSLDGWLPLALQEGWVLEREFGWRVREQRPELKLLSRRRGPLTVLLLVTRGVPADEAGDALRRHGALGPLTLATWADLGAPAADPPPPTLCLAGARFSRATEARFFGVGTFVLDLREPEETLLRRVARRAVLLDARRQGARVECGPASARDLADFLELHARLARRKDLEPAPAAALERLASREALLACRGRDGAGVTRVVNLLYVGHDQGYFLYGAGDRGLPQGLGLSAQWEGVRTLRARGLRHYDLGLVASRDADRDGVYRFKRSLGGEFVAYGEEYRRVPAWLRAPLGWLARARRR